MKKRLVVVLSLVALLLMFAAAFFLLTSEKVVVQRVQHVLNRDEKNIAALLSKMSALVSNDEFNFERLVNQTDDKTLLYVFCDDSLVAWNSNLVDPKILRRRVAIGDDTICNLFVGDFYVSARHVDDYSVYLLSLLNTTYTIQNEYLKNDFNAPLFSPFTSIRFNPDDGKYPLYNSSNKVVSRFDIESSRCSLFKSSYVSYLLMFVALIVFIAVVHFLLVRFLALKTEGHGYLTIASVFFALVAIALTYIYDRSERLKEEQRIMEVADLLINERDAEFESSYANFTKSVATDKMLLDMLYSESNMLDNVVTGYMQNLLFDTIMLQYDVALAVCRPDDELLLGSQESVLCSDYFKQLIETNHGVEVADNLYSIDYQTLDPNYLGILTFQACDTLPQIEIFMEFYRPVTPDGFALPRVLQNSNSLIPSNYSVASYRNNILDYKYGSYIYPNHLSDMCYAENDFCHDEEMKHYTIVDDNKALIVSCPTRNWIVLTAPFSLFLLAFMLLCLPFYLLYNRRRNKGSGKNNMRRKFQLMVMLTMFIAFGILVPVSFIYMLGLYHDKISDRNFETTRSILLDLQCEVAPEALERGGDDVEMLLRRFSNTFFVDMNLYDTDGRLISTSRPMLYEYKLQAPLINAEAFSNLMHNKSLYYSHVEYVGTSAFQSDYISFTDANGKTIAYLNIPYFSLDEDISNEVMNLALAYLNIVIILIGFSAIVVMVVMRRMTKPLELIQKKMSEVKIDRVNEPIAWESNDEIGELVEQYNKLVAELEESANIIARSERESAWREMARQVAHEIKNPLTPMRLSIQFLQKAWDQHVPDIEERFRRTTSTLIEQIDTLSDIASAFSNYAKLPEGNPEQTDLCDIVMKTINLYDTEENIVINFDCDKKNDYTYITDTNNMSRAIGNIIKNAIQAIGKNKTDGRIDVSLSALPLKYVIKIADNGKGIKEEDKDKIFMPNFTTKSSGMGIGLSIVHNIVQASNGRISFESEENVGTTFTIELFKSRNK